ncbi:coatomer subunit gamma-2-like [Cyclospora cayetanensis]|uniref:Coatomer subunit gamma-2-like n=1 Tax=Cyclospora cayetanensis TaxID=88456 RepID=A0A6P6RZV9_9EIME|nr:coatomer subunit gamma-2-like [Cyclospora cayetanensis]
MAAATAVAVLLKTASEKAQAAPRLPVGLSEGGGFANREDGSHQGAVGAAEPPLPAAAAAAAAAAASNRASALLTCASIPAALTFVLREAEEDFGCSDEYPLEPVSITPTHFIRACAVPQGQFAAVWQSLEEAEALTKLSLPFPSPAAAVDALLGALHMAPCEGTEAIGSNNSSHELLLSGIFVGGQQVLAKAFCLFPGDGCLLRLAVRSLDLTICEAVCSVLE